VLNTEPTELLSDQESELLNRRDCFDFCIAFSRRFFLSAKFVFFGGARNATDDSFNKPKNPEKSERTYQTKVTMKQREVYGQRDIIEEKYSDQKERAFAFL
jgi:hypothetical protein